MKDRLIALLERRIDPTDLEGTIEGLAESILQELSVDAKLLEKVAGRLHGIHRDDLTTAERQIANLLIGKTDLVWDEDHNLVWKN